MNFHRNLALVPFVVIALMGASNGTHADRQRATAIASLRAIRSALDAGANLDDFKKYQIESRIKVDALPNSPKNRSIREISDIYNVALRFSTIRVSGNASADDIDAAKRVSAYTSADVSTEIDDALSRMTTSFTDSDLDEAIARHADMTAIHMRSSLQKNRISGEEISHLLMIAAETKLSKLK